VNGVCRWSTQGRSPYRAGPLCAAEPDTGANAVVYPRLTANGTTVVPAVCGNRIVTVLATACGYAEDPKDATGRCTGT